MIRLRHEDTVQGPYIVAESPPVADLLVEIGVLPICVTIKF